MKLKDIKVTIDGVPVPALNRSEFRMMAWIYSIAGMAVSCFCEITHWTQWLWLSFTLLLAASYAVFSRIRRAIDTSGFKRMPWGKQAESITAQVKAMSPPDSKWTITHTYQYRQSFLDWLLDR